MRLTAAAITCFLACCPPLRAQVTLDPDTVPVPQQTARMMHVPPGWRVEVFAAEPTVVNPLAIDFDQEGRAYVLEARQYPQKAPENKAGADRILVLEDTDGDHRADRVRVFADGLNLASGLAVGYGGVFVGQAPELLFLADSDGDLRADRRQVLLTGWAYEDTHETLNSLTWGPDGWLYGTHGIMHHSEVAGYRFNAAVWRYHPRTKRFELVAEGTNNPWGLDYLPNGDWVISTSVIPHLYAIVPGGFHRHGLVRWWSNPYAYGEVPPIVDHRHFPPNMAGWDLVLKTDSATVPEPVSDERDPVRAYGGGHAHSGLALSHGTPVPAAYRNAALIGNLHGNRINADVIRPYRSLYVASHRKDFLTCDDPYFRPVHLRWGPDGSLYVLDWYDRQICHNTDEAVWDKRLGRIYKVIPPERPATERDASIEQLLVSEYVWHWRLALRLIAERRASVPRSTLVRMLDTAAEPMALRALWALHLSGGLTEADLRRLLADPRSELRRWAVRLLSEPQYRGRVDEFADELLRLAAREPSPRVRLELASAATRWAAWGGREALLHELMLHDEDADDPAIPALIWTAYESDLEHHAARRAGWLAKHSDRAVIQRHVLPWFLRRLAEDGTDSALRLALDTLAQVRSADAARYTLREFARGLSRPSEKLATEWARVRSALEPLLARPADRLLLARVGALFADPCAVSMLIAAMHEANRPPAERLAAVEVLGRTPVEQAREALVSAVLDSKLLLSVRRAAVQAMKRGMTRAQAAELVRHWHRVPPELQHEVLLLLATSRLGAEQLIAGMERGWVPRDDVPEGAVRRILMVADRALVERLRTVWGNLQAMTVPEARREIARLGPALATLPGNRHRGKRLFSTHCAGCHRFRGEGHAVGPDLEGAQLNDPFYLLYNIADPNRVVGAAYYTVRVMDRQGRVHQGLLVRRDGSGLELKAEQGQTLRFSRDEVEEVRVLQESLMPADIASRFTAQQFADLVAYLMGDLRLTAGYRYGPLVADRPLESTLPVDGRLNPLSYDPEGWQPFRIGPAGKVIFSMVGLDRNRRPPEAAYYVYVRVYSPTARDVTMWLDARKAARVWVNGNEVFTGRKLTVPVRFSITLRRGENELLIKLANIVRDPNAPAAAGECSFAAWLVDPEHELALISPDGDRIQ